MSKENMEINEFGDFLPRGIDRLFNDNEDIVEVVIEEFRTENDGVYFVIDGEEYFSISSDIIDKVTIAKEKGIKTPFKAKFIRKESKNDRIYYLMR